MIFLSNDSPRMSGVKVSRFEDIMGKGDSKRGNKEAKKPKKEKPKVLATANTLAPKGPVKLGSKKGG